MKKNNLIGIILAGTILCSFTGLTHSINSNSHKNEVIKNTILLTAPDTSTNSNPGKWVLTDGHYYYQSSTNNTNETGWQTIDGHVYYFNDQGVMQTGWHKQWGTKYYFNANGSQATGWTNIDNSWYYFNSQGVMQTGWFQSNGNWHYLNNQGAMQIGWTSIDNSWYYFNSQGVMQTGWFQSNGNWHYLNNQGAMQIGWIQLSGKWYYSNSQGIMQTGWLKYKNEWYYFESNGEMATNTTIDGYTINANGVATKVNIGQEIANYAQEFVGSPYVLGANGPNSFDCSGFVQYVYKHFGYNLNRTTYEQVTEGTPVTPNVTNLEPGDLIFFNVDGTNSHVGIYIGNGNFISAEMPGVGVQITPLNGPYWGPKISTARRIV